MKRPGASAPGHGAAQATYGRHDDDRWIEASGRVTRLLSDDDDESRHQRFIVTLASGQTLLIAHNLELASRLPVALGDRVTFRGLYEYNDLGGLVHWTHADPLGVEDGGWIRHRRRLYGGND